MYYMFFGDTLSNANYDALLNGWSSRAQQRYVELTGSSKNTSAGLAGRNILTSSYGWSISDGGQGS